MNREILFRGKRKDNGKWVYGFLMDEECINVPFNDIDGRFDDPVEVDPETVGQYTGVTDKNGRKMFEGDIIKYEYGGKEYIDKIIFEASLFTPSRSIRLDFSHDEIIGNIHDNPEGEGL